MANVFLKECEIKKTNHYDALKVWKFLEISKKLYLFRDKDDEKECVSLYYEVTEEDKDRDKDLDQSKKDNYYKDLLNKFFRIGNLSEEDATPINKFLMARHALNDKKDKSNVDNLFECIISKCDKNADEDKRISVAIFIEGTQGGTQVV